MISVTNIEKRFGPLDVLKSISAHFESGHSYALIGPNGSGKTTLIKSILGMVVPDNGKIEVDGESIKGQWAYREKIGYMPQIGRYPDNMTIGQLFAMIKDLRADCKTIDEELIEGFGLDKLMNKRMHTLSGGTRQKVSAALAFLFDPKVFILDEPTAGLDPLAVEVIKEKILKQMGPDKTFIITSHILSDLDDLSSHALYLDNGSLIYNDSIALLKEETGEIRLGKAIATIMKRKQKSVTA
ncbi:MAG: ABC transporter ATP-binding protein [Cyclobacteriaceae bacterium]|nr:ABC transporter ATP-binding protein [Cyclobacteriaceae bacterium]MCB0498589.1 ABC transporter ATP-binding protein [Cyclobacteriaceae bacterium]MCB9236844.1 ABC transporter ATP-binding protein [Flammeovirgaceae bacterium]MCO5271554.1 ABC transporter ATP-binding protein [Cyclobacteriaceae bacterium]MCW5901449.1 ABC transporter ATP-binding protein [Cyclobacteriaceae bacterium]